MILVSGCSFLTHYNPKIQEILNNRFDDEITNFAFPAAGNRYISRTIIETALKHSDYIDYVFVLWSGINRFDLPISLNVSESINRGDYLNYQFGNNLWFFSGGNIDVQNSKTKTVIDQYFKLCYLEYDKIYLAKEFNRYVYETALVLEALNIPFDFGCVYDYNNKSNNEYSLGHMAKKVKLQHEFSISTFPYDYCAERGLLQYDNFHPTKAGMEEWLNSIELKIDK